MADHIRYDLLTQQALRGVVRAVLADAAKKGLPGEHHFYIAFDTRAEGVRIPDRLRAQYPEQMTIILQHQFWDLKVSDEEFEVGLSFGGIPAKLTIPFAAVKGFFDPSVQFGLQFEEVGEEEAPTATPANAQDKSPASQPPAPLEAPPKAKKRLPAEPKAEGAPADEAPPAEGAPPAEEAPPTEEAPPAAEAPAAGGGAEVVRLDKFRKK